MSTFSVIPKDLNKCHIAFVDGITSIPDHNIGYSFGGIGGLNLQNYKEFAEEYNLDSENILFTTIFQLPAIYEPKRLFVTEKQLKISPLPYELEPFKGIPKSKYGWLRNNFIGHVESFERLLNNYPNIKLIVPTDYISLWLLTGVKKSESMIGRISRVTNLSSQFGKILLYMPRMDERDGMDTYWNTIRGLV